MAFLLDINSAGQFSDALQNGDQLAPTHLRCQHAGDPEAYCRFHGFL